MNGGLVALLIGANALAAEQPWVGLWAEEPAACAGGQQAGPVPPGVIRLSGTELEGHGLRCTLTRVAPFEGEGAVVFSMICERGGETYRDSPLVFVAEDGSTLSMWGSESYEHLHRCGAE
jgi:hypothetical protein